MLQIKEASEACKFRALIDLYSAKTHYTSTNTPPHNIIYVSLSHRISCSNSFISLLDFLHLSSLVPRVKKQSIDGVLDVESNVACAHAAYLGATFSTIKHYSR